MIFTVLFYEALGLRIILAGPWPNEEEARNNQDAVAAIAKSVLFGREHPGVSEEEANNFRRMNATAILRGGSTAVCIETVRTVDDSCIKEGCFNAQVGLPTTHIH